MITVFIAGSCPHCTALLADLERRRVPHAVVDLLREPERVAELAALTFERRLPVVVDHERLSVGFRGESSSFDELGIGRNG